MNYSFLLHMRAIRKTTALFGHFRLIPRYPQKQISGNRSLTFGFHAIQT